MTVKFRNLRAYRQVSSSQILHFYTKVFDVITYRWNENCFVTWIFFVEVMEKKKRRKSDGAIDASFMHFLGHAHHHHHACIDIIQF